jgi:hypothetical protein
MLARAPLSSSPCRWRAYVTRETRHARSETDAREALGFDLERELTRIGLGDTDRVHHRPPRCSAVCGSHEGGAVECTKPGRTSSSSKRFSRHDGDRMVRQQRAEPTRPRRCDKSRTQREREVMMLVVRDRSTDRSPRSSALARLDHGSPSTDDAEDANTDPRAVRESQTGWFSTGLPPTGSISKQTNVALATLLSPSTM